MKTIELACTFCGKLFEREERRHRAAVKKGHKPCCSGACQSQVANKENKNRNWSKLNPYNKIDELTPFRYFLNNMRASSSTREKSKRKTIELTPKELKEIWDKQNGVCPFTGWSLLLPPRAHGWQKAPVLRNRASVDRIDNAKGYSKDNIRFVALIVNFARNQFSDEDVRELCKSVVSYQETQISAQDSMPAPSWA